MSANTTNTFYATATDAAGNPSPCSTPAFTYVEDSTAPTATVTTPANGSSHDSTTWTGSFTGTASDALSGLTQVQYSVQRSSTGLYWNGSAFANATEGTRFTATGLTGWSAAFPFTDFPADGSYVLRVYGTDAANNTSAAVLSTFSIDTTGPSVSSINRVTGTPTNVAAVQFLVTFDESVIGAIDDTDFSVVTTGTASGASVTGVSGSGATRTVTVGTGTGEGTIRLDLVDDDSITDTLGHPLGGTGAGNGDFTTGQTYTIDRTVPTVTGVTSSSADGTYGPGATVSIQVSFSEPVNASGASLALNSGGSAGSPTGSRNSTISFSYTVATGHSSADLDYTASGALTGGTITDLAGNTAVRTLAAPGATGSLGNAKTIVVVPAKTWTGAVSTNWNTAGNWSLPNNAPNTTDDVVIPDV